jgi:hypothetical protein
MLLVAEIVFAVNLPKSLAVFSAMGVFSVVDMIFLLCL